MGVDINNIFSIILAILAILFSVVSPVTNNDITFSQNLKDLIFVQSNDLNRTAYVFDISKSSIPNWNDNGKIVTAHISTSVMGMPSNIDFTFHLSTSKDHEPAISSRGDVTFNGRQLHSLGYFTASANSDQFYPKKLFGKNPHQEFSAPWPAIMNSSQLQQKPLGVELQFDRVPTNFQRLELMTVLRLICPSSGASDFFFDEKAQINEKNIETLVSDRTIMVILNHPTKAGCPVAVPGKYAVQEADIEFIIFIAVVALVAVTAFCCCLNCLSCSCCLWCCLCSGETKKNKSYQKLIETPVAAQQPQQFIPVIPMSYQASAPPMPADVNVNNFNSINNAQNQQPGEYAFYPDKRMMYGSSQ